MGFNFITAVGNLGRDPELRYTQTGVPVCQFNIATDDRIKKNGEWVKHTTWFRVTVFGRQAESCSQYLSVGRPVCVQGRMRTEEWSDKDNKARFTNEITADHVKFLGSKDDREDSDKFKADTQAARKAEGGSSEPPTDDDVPF